MTMTISEKVAYLKGLADGMEIGSSDSKEGKLLLKIIDILEDVGLAVEDMEDEIEAIGSELDAVSEDVSDLEMVVFDEDGDFSFGQGCCGGCGEDELGDDFFEIECPSCGEDLVIDESVLDVGEVSCPNCGDRFALDLTDEEEETKE